MDLILIRHGLPMRSAASADPPLSDLGHAQARLVAAELTEERIDVVWASTMQRAIQTAEPFAAAARLEVMTHDGVCEYDRDVGYYIADEELRREDPAAFRASIERDVTDFQRAVVAALEEIIAANAGRRVAVFCHGGVINVWTAHVLGMGPRLFFAPTYASLNRYSCARTGERSVVSLNEAAHLRRLATETMSELLPRAEKDPYQSAQIPRSSKL